jgi:hypothetical protein
MISTTTRVIDTRWLEGDRAEKQLATQMAKMTETK